MSIVCGLVGLLPPIRKYLRSGSLQEQCTNRHDPEAPTYHWLMGTRKAKQKRQDQEIALEILET